MTSQSGENNRPARYLLRTFAGWLFFFACFATLYLATVQKGVGWQDSGGFQAAALMPAREHVEGYAANGNLALAHPAYVALARTSASLFHDSPARAVNAVSSICMAAAVANVWLLSLLAFARGSRLCAAVAATLFGLSHMTWWMATIAEVYATSAMMLSSELLLFSCALREWDCKRLSACGLSDHEVRGGAYILLAVITGLHLSIHQFAVLAWPIYAGTFILQAIRREVSWKVVPMAVFAWTLGLLPLSSLLSARAQVTSLSEAIINFFVGNKNAFGEEVLSIGQRWRWYFPANMGLFSLNFLNPAWILAAIGLFVARSRFANAVKLILAFHFAFFIRYLVPDQATFAVPSLMLLSLFAADGIARIKLTARVSALMLTAVTFVPPLAYIAVNAVLHRIRPAMISKHTPAPFQDEIRYRTLPWKHNENSAERFAEEFAKKTEPNAIMIADITVANALKAYFRANPTLLGHRKIFITLTDRGYAISFKALLERYRDRPWYVARPFPGYVSDDEFLSYNYEQCSSLYRMKMKD